MALPIYSTGTVAVAAGGTIVTLAGGMWSGINAKQGDFISIAGSTAVLVTEVTDATHLKIPPWPGAAQTAAAYQIYQNYVGRVVGVAAAEDVGVMLEKLHVDGLPFIVDPGETAPDPSYGDDGQLAYQPSTGKWWVKTGGVWVPAATTTDTSFYLDSRAVLAATTLPPGCTFVQTAGYGAVGDGGGALYKKVASAPTHAGKVQSVDGAWWEIAEPSPNVLMFGADRSGAAASSTAIQGAVDYVYSRPNGGELKIPAGTYLINAALTFPAVPAPGTFRLIGDGDASVLYVSASMAAAFALIVGNAAASPGGVGVEFVNFKVVGPDAKTALLLQNANIFTAHNLVFQGFQTGCSMGNSYFVQFAECAFVTMSLYGIACTTAATGLRIINCGMYNITGTCLVLTTATANVSLIGNDFETFGTLISAADLQGLLYQANYAEQAVNGYIFLNGACSAISIVGGNYFFNSTTFAWNIDHVAGLVVQGNTFYYQTLTIGPNVTDATVGANLLNNSTLTPGDAWVAYTPTFAATTGTAIVTARYKMLGKTAVAISARIQFTSAVTGWSTITLPFPSNAANGAVFIGREIAVTGLMATGTVNPASNLINLAKYDNNQWLVNGTTIIINGVYEI